MFPSGPLRIKLAHNAAARYQKLAHELDVTFREVDEIFLAFEPQQLADLKRAKAWADNSGVLKHLTYQLQDSAGKGLSAGLRFLHTLALPFMTFDHLLGGAVHGLRETVKEKTRAAQEGLGKPTGIVGRGASAAAGVIGAVSPITLANMTGEAAKSVWNGILWGNPFSLDQVLPVL